MTLDEEEGTQEYQKFEGLRQTDSSKNGLRPPSKPHMQHADSTPNFIQVHSFSSQKKLDEHITQAANANTAPGEYDLLEWMAKKLSDAYRYKKFNIPKERGANTITKTNYEKRVSFDTIDIDYCDDYEDEVDDIDHFTGCSSNPNFDDQLASSLNSFANSLNPNDSRGRVRGRSPVMSPNSRSPLASPNRRTIPSVSPSREGSDFSMDLVRLLKQKRIDYPTTPIITHRGCTFSKLHHQFENLYLGKLNNEANGYLKPVLPNRVILVYISGRKHTWVALDWVLHHFIEHGDTVIIVSAIHSRQLSKTGNRRRSSANTRPVTPMTPRMRLRQRNQPAFVKVIAKNIMSYVMEVINPSIIARVTVELAVGKTKDVLKEMYKLYEPNLACTGTKPNSRISAPLKSWLSSKLTDRLVKNFPLPVVVVPAMNINKMEDQLERDINKRFTAEVGQNPSQNSPPASQSDHAVEDSHLEIKDDVNDEDDRSSINSDDTESVSSEGSYSSYDEISKLYVDYKKDLRHNIKKLAKQEVNDQYFANFATLVSDKSAELCRDIRGVDPDFRGKGSKLARAITGSNSFGVVPYKTKSLLAPVEKPVKKETSPANPSMTYKEMKRTLLRNKAGSASPTPSTSPPPQKSSVPHLQINFHSPSPELSPEDGYRKSSLKFVNLETPLANKGRGDNKLALHRSVSYEPDCSSRPPLEPLKSHPDIVSALDSAGSDYKEKEKKSKKKKFWKIFS
jgi:hypothetical protein